jgi:hypothetical protein
MEPKSPDQDLSPYEAIIRSFGLDPEGKTLPPLGSKPKTKSKPKAKPKPATGKHEEKHVVGEEEKCEEKATHPKRRHGNRDHKIHKNAEKKCTKNKNTNTNMNGEVEKNVVEKKDKRATHPFAKGMFGIPFTLITVTSSDTLTPHPKTSRVTRSMETRMEGYQAEGENDVYLDPMEAPLDDSMDDDPLDRAKAVGYYYYYDPDSNGYYYYHPHVHCDWDLTFDQGAGICEIPGAHISDEWHVITIIFSTIGIGFGIALFAMDWQSRVLFARGGI